MVKKELNVVGRIAFIIGVILAVLSGFMSLGTTWITILILLGLIVGFLNITEGESKTYVLMAVALVIVSGFSADILKTVAVVGPYLGNMFSGIIAFITPATIVVGLKAIYSMAKDE